MKLDRLLYYRKQQWKDLLGEYMENTAFEMRNVTQKGKHGILWVNMSRVIEKGAELKVKLWKCSTHLAGVLEGFGQ